MAKTVQEYYQMIVLEVQAQVMLQNELAGELANYPDSVERMRVLLGQLTSKSKVAIWRLWAFVIAVVLWAQAKLWDKATAEMQQLANSAIRDATATFIASVRKFEYPGTAVVDPTSYQVVFLNSNPVNQILKAISIIRDPQMATVLVAKEGVNGLEKLNTAEMNNLRAYGHMIQSVGTNVQFDTRDPDELKIDLKVFYDPLSGYSPAAYVTLVKDTIAASIKKLDFRGRLQKQVLEDAIKALPGYRNLNFVTLQAKSASGLYVDFTEGEYQTVAGYIKPAVGADFTVTVLPYV